MHHAALTRTVGNPAPVGEHREQGAGVWQESPWLDAFEHWVEALPQPDPQLLELLRRAWNAALVEAMRMITRKGGRELANQLTALLSPEP